MLTEAASIPAAELPALLTWEEICEKYPREWVILIDCIDRDYQIGGGRVFAHGPDKRGLREAMHEAMNLRGHFGRYWTGHVFQWKVKVHVHREV